MKAWSEWEIVRRQVALCGSVVDAAGRPISGASVTITKAPQKFVRRPGKPATTADWPVKSDAKRPDAAVTGRGGIYFFLDLPDGNYTVEAVDRHTRQQGENHGKVSRDKDGKLLRAVVDIKLLPPKVVVKVIK